MFKKSGNSVHDYFSAILAGIFGSLAGLCAKIGLQESNIIYNTLRDSEYSNNSFLWTLTRGTFICLTIYLNLQMLKSQILSFGYIGASMTIIVAFFVNYICSLGYEIIFFGDYPTPQQMFGCLLIFAGVYLYKNQLKTNQPPQKDYLASKDPPALADIELQIVEGRPRPSDKKFVVRSSNFNSNKNLS
jgi:uncharacterized membrane protein